MNSATQSMTVAQFAIHPATRLGAVRLAVADLERQIAFYRDVLGLKLHWRESTSAGLGTGTEDLLCLSWVRGARRVRSTTGLYHFALLLPNRRELARAIGRLFSLRYANYPTDHVITKTTYLDDPEGNGIEIYAESPEDGTSVVANGLLVVQHANGAPSDGREALDVDALLHELVSGERLDMPMPEATRIGHVHLHVADLDEAMRFYHDVLGFDNQGLIHAFRMGMVSAGGYHHHIGLNTWAGAGAPPPPPDARGLRHFTIVLPDETELDRVVDRVRRAGVAVERTAAAPGNVLVRDPSQNGIVLTAAM
jgi:catechol 2,3-dioxygenase